MHSRRNMKQEPPKVIVLAAVKEHEGLQTKWAVATGLGLVYLAALFTFAL